MPSRIPRSRWHDVDKSDIRLEEVLRSFLMCAEDRNQGARYSSPLSRERAPTGECPFRSANPSTRAFRGSERRT